MVKKFNPPPNWPQPPVGWSPSPGWSPDPTWGPAPPGWQLWVDHEATPSPTKDAAGPQRIFISYRRADSQAQANGLYDGLSHRLKDARIFMDIDSIPAGVDFEQHIKKEIETCDLVLLVIGDDWLEKRPGSDVRRIDEPDDFVRLEIESALASPRVRIVPVLVEGAQMPRAEQLPQKIRRIARINAIELSDRRWTSDLQRLTALLTDIADEQRDQARAVYQAPARQSPAADSPTQFVPYVAPPTPAAEPPTPLPWSPPSQTLPARRPVPVPVPFPTAKFGGTGLSKVGKWVVIGVPLVTLGLGNFAPLLRAGLVNKRHPGLKRKLFLTAAVLEVLAIIAFVVVGTAPTDEEGTPVGAASNIGVVALLITIGAAIGLGLAFRHPRPMLPGTEEELARRQARQQYRELVVTDPDMARSINVGRPDLTRGFSDGGLVDLNSLDAAGLVRFAHLPEEEARRLVAARREVRRFHSLSHAATFADLSDASVARLEDVAVFL